MDEKNMTLFNRFAQAAGPGARIEGYMLECLVVCLEVWLVGAILCGLVALNVLVCLRKPFSRTRKQDGMLPFFFLDQLVAIGMFFLLCLRKPLARGVNNKTGLCNFCGLAWKLLQWLG